MKVTAKTAFVNLMKQYQDAVKAEDKQYMIVKDIISIDWMCDLTGTYRSMVEKRLNELLGDDSVDDWVSWFVYENDFGAKGFVCSNKDGPDIKIKNASDLWDFLNSK